MVENPLEMRFLYFAVFTILFQTCPMFGQNKKISINELEKALSASVFRLTNYINYCGTADVDNATKESVLDLILEEFTEGATMEVSNVFTQDVKELPVKKYFRNLIYLTETEGYSIIFFTYSKIKISNLSKGVGNRYTATGEFTQTFQAYRKKTEVYGDITVKFAELYIWVNGNTFEAKFGNTKVISTRKLVKQ